MSKASLGRGVAAGAAGTVVMTAAQAFEMRLTGRPPSYVPGEVASKVTGYTPRSDAALARLSLAVHCGRGLLGGARIVLRYFAFFLSVCIRVYLTRPAR
jgi:hypothetical protein